AYAYAGLGVSKLLFRHQADGSLTANGSTLVGQNWTGTRWFHGRPDDFGPYAASATQSGGDNPLSNNGKSGESGATNLGPRSATLRADTLALAKWWRAHGVNPTPDLVTTSGSGLDPDISPADARAQIPMVAAATGVSAAALRALIIRDTHSAQWGFLGSSYIVVLQLNEGLATLEHTG
ncbi:MAG TPA: potassium-transporting ATPase subunit C, partial [Acidimicrobiales bacterium]|nr:potassium-transporting ATPase subunit C [Acidimicrobiales bacterium]